MTMRLHSQDRCLTLASAPGSILQSMSGIQIRAMVCTVVAIAAAVGAASPHLAAGQDAPLISGGVGLVTSTNAGNTTYIPVVEPLLMASLGKRVTVESRATLLQSFFPRGAKGYDHDAFLGLSYLQADLLLSDHATLIAGEFLTPFGTYNERLTPIWISNFEDAPLIYSLGTMGSASSVGGQLRGSLLSARNANLDYAVYYSANSTNPQFTAQRSSGGRAGVYIPGARLEAGVSYGRSFSKQQQDFVGTHLWWEPANSALRIRSEYSHGPHSQGYWIEADWRGGRLHGNETFFNRLEPVFRMQQTFRMKADPADGLPAADTVRPDFGLDYRLPHEVRINTSYSRQLSSAGNRNIWQTEIVYRFLFPTWRSK